MDLIELTEKDKGKYNRFVMSSETGSFLQSWEWGQWQESLGQKVSRYFLLNDNQDIILSCQLVKTSLPLNRYYLYAPYGPVIDLRFKIGDLTYFIDQFKQKFPEALFIRLEPQQKIEGLETAGQKSVNIQPAVTMVVDTSKSDEELLAAMHSKTRYNIKVAQRHGVEIQSEMIVTPGHGLYVQEAAGLIIETQKRQKYRGHNFSYYQKLIDFFALQGSRSDLHIHIYKALYNRQLLTSAIMVDFGKTRMYLYGGSASEHRNVMAPYLLHFQAMQDARKLGIINYDLGGSEVSSGGERGFTRFKQGFGGRVVNYPGAYDCVWQPWAYKAYQGLRLVNRYLNKIKV